MKRDNYDPVHNMSECVLPITHYALNATLESGQTFRWKKQNDTGEHVWWGVIRSRIYRVESQDGLLIFKTPGFCTDWNDVMEYFRVAESIDEVYSKFPRDKATEAAKLFCRGLRVVKQDSWECLASFILSSNKQIVQIRQMFGLLCQNLGDPLDVERDLYTFPGVSRVARSDESELRAMRMGYRAPYLLGASRMIDQGHIEWERVGEMDYEEAQNQLMKLPGVGRKVADCVLLFGFGFYQAFPVDVWIERVLHEIYFNGQIVKRREMYEFIRLYFGDYGGYVQQYLFHWIRTGGVDTKAYRVLPVDQE